MSAAVQAVLTVMFWDPAAGVTTSANANALDETPETAVSSQGVTCGSSRCKDLSRILLFSCHSKSSSVPSVTVFRRKNNLRTLNYTVRIIMKVPVVNQW